jgi:hypothetical protein
VDCFGLLIIFSASLAADGSCLEVLHILSLPGQLLIGQASASDRRKNFREATTVAIVMLALVISERLLIEIAEQMERLDADVGSFQAALQQRPEILDAIRVNIAANVLFGMIHKLMNVILVESGIRRQFISEYFGPRFNVRAHFLLQRMALAVGDVLYAQSVAGSSRSAA